MKTRIGFLAVLLALCAGAAHAGSTSASLGVSATVSSVCTATTTPIAFGTYNPASGSALDASGAVMVTCTVGTTYSVALNAGANPSVAGDVTTRRMADASSNYLPYQIYLDSSHNTVWGNGTSGSASSGHTGDGSAQGYTAYGRIPASQYVVPGSYTDTVVATITYSD